MGRRAHKERTREAPVCDRRQACGAVLALAYSAYMPYLVYIPHWARLQEKDTQRFAWLIVRIELADVDGNPVLTSVLVVRGRHETPVLEDGDESASRGAAAAAAAAAGGDGGGGGVTTATATTSTSTSTTRSWVLLSAHSNTGSVVVLKYNSIYVCYCQPSLSGSLGVLEESDI